MFILRRSELQFTVAKVMIPCPPCQLYDSSVNDCVDPCFDFGLSSTYCRQHGCPTTTVDATSLHTWPATVRQSPVTDALSGHANTFIVVAVAIAFALLIGLGLIWRYRPKRRRSVINNGGRRTLQSPRLHFRIVFYFK